MKALALALVLSLPVPRLAPPAQVSATPNPTTIAKKKGGRWYFAETGHAGVLLGPVMTMPQGEGRLVKVATFCRWRSNHGAAEGLAPQHLQHNDCPSTKFVPQKILLDRVVSAAQSI